MTACDLTRLDAMHMRELLYAASIKSLFIDDENKEVYKRLDIADDGTLVFGKTTVPFINKLFNAEKKISFLDFAIRVAVDLCNRLKGSESVSKKDRDDILKDLTAEVIRENCINNKFGVVVDRLLDAARFGIPTDLSSRNRSNYGTRDDPPRGSVRVKHKDLDIVLPGSGDKLGVFEAYIFKNGED